MFSHGAQSKSYEIKSILSFATYFLSILSFPFHLWVSGHFFGDRKFRLRVSYIYHNSFACLLPSLFETTYLYDIGMACFLLRNIYYQKIMKFAV